MRRRMRRLRMIWESGICTGCFRYDRASDFHKLVYAIKYRSNRELGVWTGKMLGERMKMTEG